MPRKKIKFELANDTKTMAKAREEFLLNCKARNLVDESIVNHEKTTRYFMNFMGEDFNIYDLTRSDLDNYVADCLKRVESNTARSYCKLLKVFFKYHELDIEMEIPKESFKYKTIYTDEEIALMLQPPKRKSFSTMRDHAVVCFLFSTGVRMRTVINIKVKDLDFDNNLIFLETTKTKKQYYIPMSTQLKKVLRQYLNAWPHTLDDYLFPNQFGERLCKTSLGTLIKNYNESRGVHSRGIHRFRNTFATNYVKNNGDVFRLQQLLGHSKIDTTRRYVTLDIEDLKVDYDSFNILDNFATKNERIKLKKK